MQDLQQQSAMLQKEYEYEKELYRQQTREAGIPKRIQQGVCWFPVKLGADRYNSLNQLTVEVTRTETEETEHSFEYGCPVCFFRISADRQIRYFNFSAVISYVQDNKMVVVLPGPQVLPELVVTGELGVQLYFDDTSYKTMFAALREVAEAKGNRTARLREVLLGKAPALRRETGPVRFPWLNASQEKAVNQVLCAKEVAVVHGPPGTGKTLLALAAALGKLTEYKQILLARPIVALSNKDLGFLPGDATEKVAPYMQPLFDNLNVIKRQFASNSTEVKRLEDMQKSEQLVIEALAFIRGRSLSETYCIIDEAQNLTPHEIKTIITRAGEGTKMVFTGDIQQIDSPYLDAQSNGLAYMIDKMKGQDLFAHINLIKGERSELSELASDLL